MPVIACAVFIEGDKVLLGKRSASKRNNPGGWDLIGGHVDPGEDAVVAVVREVQEEIGLTPTQFELLEVVSKPDIKDGVETEYHIFAVTKWEGEQPELLGDEHTELGWFPLAEIATLSSADHPYMPTLDWTRLGRG